MSTLINPYYTNTNTNTDTDSSSTCSSSSHTQVSDSRSTSSSQGEPILESKNNHLDQTAKERVENAAKDTMVELISGFFGLSQNGVGHFYRDLLSSAHVMAWGFLDALSLHVIAASHRHYNPVRSEPDPHEGRLFRIFIRFFLARWALQSIICFSICYNIVCALSQLGALVARQKKYDWVTVYFPQMVVMSKNAPSQGVQNNVEGREGSRTSVGEQNVNESVEPGQAPPLTSGHNWDRLATFVFCAGLDSCLFLALRYIAYLRLCVSVFYACYHKNGKKEAGQRFIEVIEGFGSQYIQVATAIASWVNSNIEKLKAYYQARADQGSSVRQEGQH